MKSSSRTDASLKEELQLGMTLPSTWYVDEDSFEAEKRRIFHRSWQYVGNIAQVTSPGDFFTTRVGDIPIVVVRDTEGIVRVHANVCRHRGSEVVLECAGNRKTLQCHYHGWTYNLDGQLRSAPRSNEQAEFQKDRLSLVSFAIDTFGPLIFVSPQTQATPLHHLLGGIPAMFERAGVDLSRLKLYRQDVYEQAANWKIIVENFNECYHCPIAHPAFSEMIDVDSYRVDSDHEYYSTYFGPYRKGREKGVTYATLWPNIMFAVSDDPPAMQVLCAQPVDAGHTRQTVDYYFGEDASDEQLRGYVALSDLVTREDVVLCESVQRGMKSGVVSRGHLMLSRERGIQHFQKLVHRFMTEPAETN